MTARLGIAFVPHHPPERLESIVRAADAHLDALWVWEDCFAESGIATATAALAWSTNLRVGLALMPAPLRNVALTAMEIATVQRLFPGRFIPGVGHGVQEWMGQIGVRAGSPMGLLTEYAAALRALLAGELVSRQGRYVQLDQVRLAHPPAAGEPLYLGGVGPKTVALCARHGDGVLLSWTSHDDFARLMAVVASAASERAPHEAPVRVSSQIVVATGPGAHERARTEMGRWRVSPDPGTYAAGSAEQIADTLRARLAAGATHLMCQATVDEPSLEEWIAFLGEEVAPLLD